MRFPSLRFLSLLAGSVLLCCSTQSVFASDGNDAREVRLVFVQGDVRLSPGDGKNPVLDKDWQQAESGISLEQGYSLATGTGRAEIEFENGSTVYLAENSLLLFTELSAPRDRIVSRMSLPTGAATFSLQPVAREIFFIETPTDKIEITAPDAFFARMDAYLDATAITPQGEKGEDVTCNYILQTPSGKFEDASPDTSSARINIYIGFVSAIFSQVEEGQVPFRDDLWDLVIPKGQTMFFRGCEIVDVPHLAQAVFSARQALWLAISVPGLQETASALSSSGFAPLVPGGLLLQELPTIGAPSPQIPPSQPVEKLARSATLPSQTAPDWDRWVAARVKERESTTAAALKASGLSAPVPGLADMYANGSFFPCEPYGTCWEPIQQETQQAPSQQTSSPSAQLPNLNTPNTVFQPQTVEWTQRISRACLPDTFTRVSRVARTPQELDELLRQKDLAGRQALRGSSLSDSCLQQGVWIRHQGHYARVLTQRIPPSCVGKGCKVVHPPRPVWVRINGRLGFVPRHPNDVKGKPPVNLKNGIIIPPAKSGEPTQHVAWNPSQKVKFLDKTPKEFRSESTLHLPLAAAPKIQAHLMQEATQAKSLAASNHADSHILYDYKSHNFIMPANTSAGAKSKEVAVGGITSHGGVRSFADGRSEHYAESFGHTSAAASYSGGGHNSGSYSSSSSYSHGGGSSGSSYSGGGGSSGAHSSGGSSSSAGTSPASSSSVSSSSSGGSHGRP